MPRTAAARPLHLQAASIAAIFSSRASLPGMRVPQAPTQARSTAMRSRQAADLCVRFQCMQNCTVMQSLSLSQAYMSCKREIFTTQIRCKGLRLPQNLSKPAGWRSWQCIPDVCALHHFNFVKSNVCPPGRKPRRGSPFSGFYCLRAAPLCVQV